MLSTEQCSSDPYHSVMILLLTYVSPLCLFSPRVLETFRVPSYQSSLDVPLPDGWSRPLTTKLIIPVTMRWSRLTEASITWLSLSCPGATQLVTVENPKWPPAPPPSLPPPLTLGIFKLFPVLLMGTNQPRRSNSLSPLCCVFLVLCSILFILYSYFYILYFYKRFLWEKVGVTLAQELLCHDFI